VDIIIDADFQTDVILDPTGILITGSVIGEILKIDLERITMSVPDPSVGGDKDQVVFTTADTNYIKRSIISIEVQDLEGNIQQQGEATDEVVDSSLLNIGQVAEVFYELNEAEELIAVNIVIS